MTFTLYENPACSKCRETVRILQSRGIEFERVNYIVTPLDKPTLVRLLAKLGMRPHDLVRIAEDAYAPYREHHETASDDEILDRLARLPALVQRPILEAGDRAVLGRPAEKIAEFLDSLNGPGVG